jgi:hypothetical protein
MGAELPTPIVLQDNLSTIQLAKIGGAASNASRHINMRYFSVKEYIDKGAINIQHQPTLQMVADILTKPLCGELFKKLRNMLLNW